MDEDYSFQRQALPVPPLPPNFNPDVQPESGEQYLQQVLYERTKKCADIVHVPAPSKKLPCKSILKVFNDDTNRVPPSQKQSTIEWQQIQMENFTQLRDRITKLKELSVSEPPQELPDIEEPESWKTYCQTNQPLLKIITSIRMREIEILLEYLETWLKEEEIATKSWITLWIYGCLSCLFTPLEPNSCSVLREIAKTCRALRGENTTETEENISYSLLICLISTYFRQLDLSDTFN
ncbi:protein Gemin2 [Culicoides brevitarsis]|uniref:protein Gemin2 n=1 Tax=Culicoides brevitarsis TaxID=469753 RepID=UPI00307B9E37